MKRICTLFLVITSLTIFLFAGCTKKQTAEPLQAATLAGPSGMGLIKMIDSADTAYNITVYTAPDQITPKILNGEVDIATIPSNLAAVLYAKTNGAVSILASNTMGVLYLVENGGTVNSIADLEGKKIYSSGQGASPEFVFNEILSRYDLTPGENVEIEYVANHSDLANMILSGTAQIAVLPEPFVSAVTLQNPNIVSKISLNHEWEQIFGEGMGLALTATVVRNDYLQQNPKLVKQFMKDYADSVKFVNSDTDQAALLMAEHKIVASDKIALQAIPRSGISFVTGEECRDMFRKYFQVLYEGNPQSVGGALPDDAIYYIP